MRVVYLDHTAVPSGGELALFRLLTNLPSTVEPHVIFCEDGPLVDMLRDEGIYAEVIQLPEHARGFSRKETTMGLSTLSAALGLIRYAVRLSRRLKDIHPDIIHTNSLKAGVYGGLSGKLVRVPVVWHLRDRLDDPHMARLAQRAIPPLVRLVATAVIGNSSSTLQTASWRGDPTLARVIPSGVSLKGEPRAVAAGVRPGDLLMVGLVGRLTSWKGQDLFLRAFAAAFEPGSAKAVIVGGPLMGEADERYERSLHSLASELGIESVVEFRGHREDIAAELSRLDILVHASLTPEPFGQVIVEGMACGVPVIAAGAGGPLETITHRHDGLLFTPGDSAELAGLLRELADDPGLRASLSSAGLRRAADFSVDKTSAAVVDLYTRVLDRS